MAKERQGAIDPLSALDMGDDNTNRYYKFYYQYLVEMATSIFEWHNLPTSVNSWYLEMALLNYGNVIYFNDETLGTIITNCSMDGNLNLYNEPTGYNTVNPNYPPHHFQSFWGQPINLKPNNYCVAIANSFLKRPYIDSIQTFAQDLSEISAIQNINLNAQKTPVLHMANGFNNLTTKSLVNQLDHNPMNLIISKNLDIDSIKSLDTGAQYLVDKIETQKHAKWNEILTFLGINNANIDKKERVNQKETQGNDSQVMISRYNRLGFRQLACDRINQLFGTNVSVEFRQIDTTMPDDTAIDTDDSDTGDDE